jgi:hypothetical protein
VLAGNVAEGWALSAPEDLPAWDDPGMTSPTGAHLAVVATVLSVLGAGGAPVASAPDPPPERPHADVRVAGVRIAAAGDIACEPPFSVSATTCRHGATARLISRRRVAAVLLLGDTQYDDGRLRDYRRSYDPSWGAFKHRSYPVAGNHEYRQAGAAGYFAYFGARAHGPRGYYAYDLGAWRLYALNSNCDHVNCSQEVTWLRRNLRAHPRRCALAYMHHPRFSSGDHGDNTYARRLWPALDAAQVDVVLAGHDHDYERFAPRTASGAVSASGIRSWVVGTGGKDLTEFHAIEPGSQRRWRSRAGVLFMTLDPRSYAWKFRSIDGVVRDAGTSACVR